MGRCSVYRTLGWRERAGVQVLGEFLGKRNPVFIRLAIELFHEVVHSTPSSLSLKTRPTSPLEVGSAHTVDVLTGSLD